MKRVRFCTRNTAFSSDNFKKIDECLFHLHRSTLGYWTRNGSNSRSAIPKFYVFNMVWWGLSEKCYSFAYIQRSLSKSIVLDYKSLFSMPTHFLTMSYKKTKYTKEWYEIQSVWILQWPSNVRFVSYWNCLGAVQRRGWEKVRQEQEHAPQLPVKFCNNKWYILRELARKLPQLIPETSIILQAAT